MRRSADGWTVRQFLNHGQEYLAAAPSLVRHETPALDADVLLRHVLGLSRAALYTHPERRLEAPEWQRYQACLAGRAAGEPVAYLTGEREFMGLPFAVDRCVLIPRPETELVVERALALIDGPAGEASGDGVGAQSFTVLDVGTGSGAIAVSVAALAPQPGHLRIYATDRSWGALEVARGNARRLLQRAQLAPPTGRGAVPLRQAPLVASAAAQTADTEPGGGPTWRCPVRFVQCSLVSGLRGEFDLVLANLPYIPAGEIDTLPVPVRDYEPVAALDGGPDGLDLYRELLGDLPGKLRSGATLLLECDPRQIPALSALARAAFPGCRIETLPDLAGRERVLQVS
ncbi:MAG: peptide chain release factor N(5)-glutamine methyltransferase [Chloroflexota bacterium]|nr:peptide chain release factor N(5)-glutamine methyltransferase [Chloroflexota bacterium]